MPYLLVLGNDWSDENSSIGPGTQARCRAAARRWTELIKKGRQVTVIFAAGRDERMPEGITMAQQMRTYTQRLVGPSGFQYIVNMRDDEVWGVIREIQWALDADKVRRKDEFEAVISRQAAWRVCLIGWLFFGRRIRIVHSGETTPWRHEVLAYAKLAAYAVGLGGVVERLRRRYYREW